MLREEHLKNEDLHLSYDVSVTMEGIRKDKKHLELLEKLNENSDCEIKLEFEDLYEEEEKEYSYIHSTFDTRDMSEVLFTCDKKNIFDSFDVAIKEFSKKYNNSIIEYTKYVGISRYEIGIFIYGVDSYKCYIKDGTKIAEYVKYYRPVYNDGIKKIDREILYNDLKFENDLCLIKGNQSRTDNQNMIISPDGGFYLVFKKPLQLYYLINNDGEKKEVSYNEFIKIFSTSEIKIFDEDLKPVICDEKDITNTCWVGCDTTDPVETGEKCTLKDVDDILTKVFEKGGFNELEKCFNEFSIPMDTKEWYKKYA
ncbi:MAG: hypothetical protein IJ593_00465 [Lachnospiraceae bacterium]|nr:hypothetical protein [Lachnospiraceae bacterium]